MLVDIVLLVAASLFTAVSAGNEIENFEKCNVQKASDGLTAPKKDMCVAVYIDEDGDRK